MPWSLAKRSNALVIAVAVVALTTASMAGALAASVIKTGKSVTAVRAVMDDNYRYTASSTPVDMPSMTLSVNVPDNQRALLVITFSAESFCTSESATYCWVRVMVDNSVASPGDVIWGSGVMSDYTGNSWQANSMQFVHGPVNAGSHTVKVQWWDSDNDGGNYFGDFVVESRTLSVLRARV